ncbi:FimV/HubP family polar landmark protein [Pseudomonas monteilii]
MLRIRKMVLAIAAATALSSGVVNALELGDLTLKSGQGQPLDAEIELRDVQDLTAADLRPSLAGPEEFSRAGIPMPAYLEDLTFTPVIVPNGRSVLRVTSSAALPAPVVKFLVQVMWPQGRLLRDYDVALDRPQPQPSRATPGVQPAVTAADTYTSRRRDTLWQIAARNAQGGSVQQTMLAIQALNPGAFINNNINQLKVGQVLRLPDAQQIQSIPQREAEAEVAEQYAAWREGRRLGPRARQLDATRRTSAGAAPAQVAQADNLRLVAPETTAAANDARALNDQLAVAQESLDTSRRDNEELKSRMTDLESQLDKLQRLIELKNDQLARLSQQAGMPAATPSTAGGAGTPAATPALPGETPAEAAGATPVTGAADTPPPVAATPSTTSEPVIQPAPAAAGTQPEATPAEATPSARDPLDTLLGNPWLLAVIAGSLLLVLLLLVLIILRKRKAQQEAEKHLRMARELAEEQNDPELDLPPGSFDELDIPHTLSPAVVAASTAAAMPAEQAQSREQAEALAADRVLMEAELKIADGRLNDAAELLEAGVAAHPSRNDLRLKLMEVYGRQGDRDGFVSQERQLPATHQNQTEVDTLKQRFPAMLGMVAAGLGAAALATERDEQYVQTLLDETPRREPVMPGAAREPEVEDDPLAEVPDEVLGAAADLEVNADLPVAGYAEPPVLEPVTTTAPGQAPAAPVEQNDADADDDFEAMLAQAQAQAAGDAFDLDVGTPDADEPFRPDDAFAVEDGRGESRAAAVNEPDLGDDFDLSLALDDDSPAARNFASELDDVNAELDRLSDSFDTPAASAPTVAAATPAPESEPEPEPEPEPVDDLDFDFFSGADEVATKLDLARAYVDMGDPQGARDILDEVVKDGDEGQRLEARELLSRLV